MNEITKEMGIKGGKAAKRPYRYGIRDVAEAAGLKLSTVRRHRREGRFDIGVLVSVAEYVMNVRGVNWANELRGFNLGMKAKGLLGDFLVNEPKCENQGLTTNEGEINRV